MGEAQPMKDDIAVLVAGLVHQFRQPAGLFITVRTVRAALNPVVEKHCSPVCSGEQIRETAYWSAVAELQRHGLYLSHGEVFGIPLTGQKVAEPDGSWTIYRERKTA